MKTRIRRRLRNAWNWLLAWAAGVTVLAGGAWALMITAGNAHRDWWHHVPVMGYGTAVVLVTWPAVIIWLTAAVIAVLNRQAK